MAIVNFVPKQYDKLHFENPIGELITYACNPSKTAGVFGGVNTSCNPYMCEQEMKSVKQYFMKEDGRELIHVIVSDEIFNRMSLQSACYVGYQIGSYYGSKFQVFFGFHHQNLKGSNCNHYHFIINSVSYINGAKYSESFAEREKFKQYVESILKYMFARE